MRKKFFSFLVLMIFLTVGSYKISSAFFASTAISQNNTFATASEFPTGTPSATFTPTPTGEVVLPTPTPTTGPDHLVINEVSPIGGTDNDWVEIFNPTSSAIDISGWKISDNNGTDDLPPSTIVPSNGYAVIVASGSATVVPGSALRIELGSPTIGGTGGIAAAGDVITLLLSDNSTIVDAMSYGSNTSVFTLPTITSTPIYARNPNGQDTDTVGDWVLQTATIGISNN